MVQEYKTQKSVVLMKLLVTRYPPDFPFLIPLRLKRLSQARCTRTPAACVPFLVVNYNVLHPDKITGKMIILLINHYSLFKVLACSTPF